jgi:hypothetical protein
MKNDERSGNSDELYEKMVHLQKIEVEIPIRTVSEANSSEHWTKKHARKKQQRKICTFYLKSTSRVSEKIELPCLITLTRISPRFLDTGDNLPCSFKHMRDVIAELITGDTRPGLADSDDRLTWEYKQEKGKPKQYGIRITFEFA